MPRHPNLPRAEPEYHQSNEHTTRTAIEQEIIDLFDEMRRVESNETVESTMALRQQQFLLMGAGSS